MNFLAPHADKAYAAMRIVLGFLFIFHGIDKVFGTFHGHQATNALMWAAAIIELLGGALIMVGFMTRYAAFLCSGTMAVGYFMAHQGKGTLPIQNGGELAVVLSFAFLYIACRGSGIWSVDRAIKK